MSPKHLPAPLRPREKLLAHGAAALADTELLSLLLRTGPRGEGVYGLAQRLVERFDGLSGLLHAPPAALGRCKGVGPSQQAGLLAVMELARRALAQGLRECAVLDAPEKAKNFVASRLAGLSHEVFAVLFLDTQHRLLDYEEMFRGTLTHTSVYPREVVRRALAHNAAALVLAHNHPSGVAEPSAADEHLTASLRSALSLVDVRVLDHLVVGRGVVVSMAERGLL